MGSLNQSVFELIHQFAGISVFLDDISVFFAQYLPYLLGIGFFIIVWYAGEWRKKMLVFAEGAIAVMLSRGLVTEIIRFFYHHPRPFDVYGFAPLISESGSSFPSGHAAFFFALTVVIWYVNRTWGVWYLVLSSINGLARVYTGVHWPLDILGGAIIGIACALFVHWLLRGSREKLDAQDRAVPQTIQAP